MLTPELSGSGGHLGVTGTSPSITPPRVDQPVESLDYLVDDTCIMTWKKLDEESQQKNKRERERKKKRVRRETQKSQSLFDSSDNIYLVYRSWGYGIDASKEGGK